MHISLSPKCFVGQIEKFFTLSLYILLATYEQNYPDFVHFFENIYPDFVVLFFFITFALQIIVEDLKCINGK